MLLPQFVSRACAIIALLSVVTLQCPTLAEDSFSTQGVKSQSVHRHTTRDNDDQLLLASNACESCGAPLLPVAVAGIGKKGKNKSLLTDSLWGNLILELAYDRDPELSKLAKRVKLMNFGTTTSVLGIAGGTLAQGISALYVLNPPDGQKDSYAPLNVGVALSGATMLVMAARLFVGHELAKHIQQRQILIRDRVQSVLAHLEHSDAQCTVARSQLQDLIGERACNEWVQLWQSSHKLAQNNSRRVSLHTDAQPNIAERLCHEDSIANP